MTGTSSVAASLCVLGCALGGLAFGQEAELLSGYHITPPFHDEGHSMLEEENVRHQIEALQEAVELEKKVLKLWERVEI